MPKTDKGGARRPRDGESLEELHVEAQRLYDEISTRTHRDRANNASLNPTPSPSDKDLPDKPSGKRRGAIRKASSAKRDADNALRRKQAKDAEERAKELQKHAKAGRSRMEAIRARKKR